MTSFDHPETVTTASNTSLIVRQDFTLAQPYMDGSQTTTARQSYDRYLGMGITAIFILVFGILVWSLFAQLQGAVIAPGTVIVESKPKIIQHRDGGIVGDILVKDGDKVEVGQILIRLDPTQLEADRVIVQTRLNESMARVARLEAERDGLNEIQWPEGLQDISDSPSVAQAMTGQRRLFEARIDAANGHVRQLTQRIAQSNDQIVGLRSLIASKTEQAAKIAEEIAAKSVLVEQGWLAKPFILTLEREKLRLEGEISNHRAEISRFQNTIGETDVQILQLKRDRQSEVLAELRVAQTERTDFREQLTSAVDRRQRIALKAPDGGVVHNLAFNTIGGVIGPGEEIMRIIPQDDRLIVESQVKPSDIDQIYSGQEARIRFSAFSQRTTPEVAGIVLSRSADRVVNPATGIAYYTVTLEVPPESLTELGGLNLIPGMPAEAFMQTESRSVFSYIWKPVSDAMSRAGREE